MVDDYTTLADEFNMSRQEVKIMVVKYQHMTPDDPDILLARELVTRLLALREAT